MRCLELLEQRVIALPEHLVILLAILVRVCTQRLVCQVEPQMHTRVMEMILAKVVSILFRHHLAEQVGQSSSMAKKHNIWLAALRHDDCILAMSMLHKTKKIKGDDQPVCCNISQPIAGRASPFNKAQTRTVRWV